MVSYLLRPSSLIVVITGLGGGTPEVVERILIHCVASITTSEAIVVVVVGGISTERIT